jgi:hypothetical protein
LQGNRHTEVKRNVILSSSGDGVSSRFARAHGNASVQESENGRDLAKAIFSTQARRLRPEKSRGENGKANSSSTCHRRCSTLQYRLAKAIEERKERHWRKVPELSTSVDTETSLSSDVNSYRRERRLYTLKARKKAWKSDKGNARIATATTAKLTSQASALAQLKPRVLYLLQLYRRDLTDTPTLEKKQGIKSATTGDSTVDISETAIDPHPPHSTQLQISESRSHNWHGNNILVTDSAIESHSDEGTDSYKKHSLHNGYLSEVN